MTLTSLSGSSAVASSELGDGRIADVDRRFYAFAVDRLIAWSIDAAAGVVVVRTLADDHPLMALGVVVATVLVVGLVFACLQGTTGRTPGKSLADLRLVDTATERPIGVRRAVLRGVVLGLAAVPFGFGLAALAWTSLADRSRLRRGWHDRLVSSIVVDVRPEPAPEAPMDEGPRHVVNLTAMRLAPAHRLVGAIERPPTPSRAPRHAAPRSWVPAETPGAACVVSFDSGERVEVDTLLLVGRSPDPRLGEQGARLVTVPSADLSVSKTHLEVVVAGDGALVVTDRGSTNGSTLVRQSTPRHLSPGRATTLLEGDVVIFGDRRMSVVRGTGP